MANWYMLTLVGQDQQGIVAQITQTLFENGYDLGEASMMRLGGNFTVMLMISHPENKNGDDAIAIIKDKMGLCVHSVEVSGGLHQHVEPNVRVTVLGTDRAGIVAEVTGVLAEQGVNIVDLESDVGGTAQAPIYIMHIEGVATNSTDDLVDKLAPLNRDGIEIQVMDIETLVG